MAKAAQSQWDAVARAAREAYSAQQRRCLAETYLRGNLETLNRYIDISDDVDDGDILEVARRIADTGEQGLLARLKAIARERDAEADLIWRAVTATEAALHDIA